MPSLVLQEVIINNMPAPSWVVPTLTLAGVVVGGFVTWLSTRASDKRKHHQEDRRRWDSLLVEASVDLLTLCDDVASTDTAQNEKRKRILAEADPAELNRLMTKIRLLTNEKIGDLSQSVVLGFLIEQRDLKRCLETDDWEDGLSLASTSSAEYTAVRNEFADAIQAIVVADSVRFFEQKASLPSRLKHAWSLIVNGDPEKFDWADLSKKARESRDSDVPLTRS